jgi:pyruvate dehydrogenase kinase 2/3/4
MDDTRLGVLHSASSRGIKATVVEQIRSWRAEQSNVNLNNKDPEREAGIVPYARIGLGLPMSNIFTMYVVLGWCLQLSYLYRFFGGTLELVSLDGWGE